MLYILTSDIHLVAVSEGKKWLTSPILSENKATIWELLLNLCCIQSTLSKADTLGTKATVRFREVSALERVPLQRYKCNSAGSGPNLLSGLESVRIERVDCILQQLFALVSLNSGGYLPHQISSVNIHRYSPPLRRIIVKYCLFNTHCWLKPQDQLNWTGQSLSATYGCSLQYAGEPTGTSMSEELVSETRQKQCMFANVVAT